MDTSRQNRFEELSQRFERSISIIEGQGEREGGDLEMRVKALIKELYERKEQRRPSIEHFKIFIEKLRGLFKTYRAQISQPDLIQNHQTEELEREIRTSVRALEFLFGIPQEVDYSEEVESTVTIPSNELDRIHNAVLYNTSNITFQVVPEASLIQCPGKATVSMHQNGNIYSLQLDLHPVQVDTSEEDMEKIRFEEAYSGPGEESIIFFNPKTSLIDATGYFLNERKHVNGKLGRASMQTEGGKKDFQREEIFQLFDRLDKNSITIFGEGIQVRKLYRGDDRTNLRLEIKNSKGEVYFLSATDEGLQFTKDETTNQNQITTSRSDFEAQLNIEIELINRVLGFIYQDAEAQPQEGQMKVVPPTEELLQGLRKERVFSRVREVPNTFEELGARKNQIRSLTQVVLDFIECFWGRPAIKPSNVVVCGESGNGKSALLFGMIDLFLREGIPVFELKGVETAQKLASSSKENIFQYIQEMFFFLKIFGGVLVVHDLDALIGVRPGSEMDMTYRTHVQNLIHKELEVIRNHPQVLFISNTQYIGAFEESWTKNEQRLGRVEVVDRLTRADEIEAVLEQILRKIHTKNLRKELPPEGLAAHYKIDFQSVVDSLLQEDSGGYTPAVLKQAIKNCIGSIGLSTVSIITAINDYVRTQDQLQKSREEHDQKMITTRVEAIERKLNEMLPIVMQILGVLMQVQKQQGESRETLDQLIISNQKLQGFMQELVQVRGMIGEVKDHMPKIVQIEQGLAEQAVFLEKMGQRASSGAGSSITSFFRKPK